jgi:hypothetical protein
LLQRSHAHDLVLKLEAFILALLQRINQHNTLCPKLPNWRSVVIHRFEGWRFLLDQRFMFTLDSGDLGLFSAPTSMNKLLPNSRTTELPKSSGINGIHSLARSTTKKDSGALGYRSLCTPHTYHPKPPR